MPTVSGLVVSIFKAVKGALLAAAMGIYGILAVLGVTVGYGVRSFFGYLQTKQKYQLNLTESLYYRNLDNNAGVLCRLLDEAEEQENREAVLAYYFLWRLPAGGGYTADSRLISTSSSSVARPSAGRSISKSATGAGQAGAARPGVQAADGRYLALPLNDSLRALDLAWDNYFSYNAAA